MGTITRFWIDEYPHSPHRGTGMYGATPRQKLDEMIEAYGGIEAPEAEMLRLHLGEKTTATTTSEGVKIFNIPYNSTALQKFAAGAPKEVTVLLNPDDLRSVSIQNQENADVITADLRMTTFADLTLEEAIADMRSAIEDNPEKRALHDEHLRKARARRVRESGFFPDSNLPSSYTKIDELRRQADQIANVEYIPMSRTGPSTAPGNIMHRDPQGSAQTVETHIAQEIDPTALGPKELPSASPIDTSQAKATSAERSKGAPHKFKPIKKSKL
ncbi:Mu transposase C-terminal domain-containing protein [Yoonia sp. SS1-5]|uniref:Mu transposase C-terminal domain-containing protein n=1 Tax=Yoonia rhodophyticola TaxID=3137370 RepID=A0AAN0MDF2_9RHOB